MRRITKTLTCVTLLTLYIGANATPCPERIVYAFKHGKIFHHLLAIEIHNQTPNACIISQLFPWNPSTFKQTQYALLAQNSQCWLFFGRHAQTTLKVTCPYGKTKKTIFLKSNSTNTAYAYGPNTKALHSTHTHKQTHIHPNKKNLPYTQPQISWTIGF
jgi:hypothetical protein